MTKESNFWIVSLKVILMSVFATIISFMFSCLIAAVSPPQWYNGDAVGISLFTQLVGTAVEFIFIYGTLWECGHNDRLQINLGLKDYSKYRGVLIGLVAAVPYYLMAIAMMLMSFDVIYDITGLMRVLSAQFWGLYQLLLPVATSSTAGVGPTFAQSVATPAQAICAVFVPTIIPLISYIPYTLGRKDISLGERLILVNKKK